MAVHLPLAPAPCEHPGIHPSAPDGAFAVRRLRCIHVSACLDVAIANNWPAFACTGCRAYVEIHYEQQREDCGRIATMIRACPRKPVPIAATDEAAVERRRGYQRAARARARARRTEALRAAVARGDFRRRVSSPNPNR